MTEELCIQCRQNIQMYCVFRCCCFFTSIYYFAPGAPPVFTWPADDGSTVVTIDENDEGAGAQTLSHTLSATPANASYAVTYSITAGDTALFEITSPGVLLRQKPAATFDFESGTTSYSLTIR